MSLISAMLKTYKGNNLEHGQVEKLQNKRLKELVKYARNNSPYFNKLYININKDYKLQDLPTTNKIKRFVEIKEGKIKDLVNV